MIVIVSVWITLSAIYPNDYHIMVVSVVLQSTNKTLIYSQLWIIDTYFVCLKWMSVNLKNVHSISDYNLEFLSYTNELISFLMDQGK